jgi:ACS family tartrate transporter-like MFS transporter
MTDRPGRADWLTAEEKTWLQARIDGENRQVESAGRLTLMRALADPRVVALSAIYLMSVTANYGIVFFMPQIIKGIGLTNMMTGLVSSVPYIIGTIGLIATRSAAGISSRPRPLAPLVWLSRHGPALPTGR